MVGEEKGGGRGKRRKGKGRETGRGRREGKEGGEKEGGE